MFWGWGLDRMNAFRFLSAAPEAFAGSDECHEVAHAIAAPFHLIFDLLDFGVIDELRLPTSAVGELLPNQIPQDLVFPFEKRVAKILRVSNLLSRGQGSRWIHLWALAPIP